MSCKDPGSMWDFFCEFLEEDIDSPVCRELKDHMIRCPDCRSNVDSIKKTISLYRQSFPDTPLSPGLKDQMLQRLLSDR